MVDVRKVLMATLGDKAEKMDEHIIEYAIGVLEDEEDLATGNNEEELVEMFSPFFADSGCVDDDDEAEELCKKFAEQLRVANGGATPVEAGVSDGPVKRKVILSNCCQEPNIVITYRLNAPVSIASMEEDKAASDAVTNALTDMTRNVPLLRKSVNQTQVDQAQLADAEAKAKVKAEKKAAKELRQKELAELKEKQMASNAAVVIHRTDEIAGAKPRDLKLENITITAGGKTLIEGQNLTLVFGRKYGFIGRNGIGKSTLLRAISGRELDVPKHLQILHVEQEVVGDETSALDSVLAADLERQQLLLEEKHILADFDDEKPKDNPRLLAIYQRLDQIDAHSAPARAAAILAGLSFTTEMQNRATKEFSGGWRMRIALARALFCEPDILLLDEPTNHLDLHAILWLESHLIAWKRTLVLVSHERQFLNEVSTDIIHFSNGCLFSYKGNYDDFDKIRHEKILLQQRQSESQDKKRAHVQSFIDRFRFNAKRASLVQSRIKLLEKMTPIAMMVDDPTITFNFPDPEPLQAPILKFVEVKFGYTEEKIIFEDVNFHIDMDARVALVGANGAGKTTLLKLFSEEIKPITGSVVSAGKLRLSKFSQHHVDQLDTAATPLQYMMDCFPGQDSQVYRTHLGRFGITGPLALQNIGTLSGGQKSRVSLAHIAWRNPHLLLLDEPTNHLDIDTIESLATALNVFKGAVVLVSHDQRLIELVCDELWVCANGKVTPFPDDFTAYKKKLLQYDPAFGASRP